MMSTSYEIQYTLRFSFMWMLSTHLFYVAKLIKKFQVSLSPFCLKVEERCMIRIDSDEDKKAMDKRSGIKIPLPRKKLEKANKMSGNYEIFLIPLIKGFSTSYRQDIEFSNR